MEIFRKRFVLEGSWWETRPSSLEKSLCLCDMEMQRLFDIPDGIDRIEVVVRNRPTSQSVPVVPFRNLDSDWGVKVYGKYRMLHKMWTILLKNLHNKHPKKTWHVSVEY